MFRARALVAAAATLTLLACAGGASAGSSDWMVRWKFVPSRAYQGLPAAVSVQVRPAGATCQLLVRYADGSLQLGLATVVASQGTASWKWTLAPSTPAGPARVAAACYRRGTVTRTITIVGTTARHSKLRIVASGFSQRADSVGTGSSVSYGVVLHNPSTTEDAGNVTVLVNFIDAANHVLETTTNRVGTISAATSFDVGGWTSLPSQTAVNRLEIVVQTQAFSPHKVHAPPVQNVQIVASRLDPNWVGEVDGEVVNDDPSLVLSNAQLSVVLFDASGNIVGGGTGFVFASLPPGTRSYFSASSGFSDVPIDHASTAEVSVVPSYQTP